MVILFIRGIVPFSMQIGSPFAGTLHCCESELCAHIITIGRLISFPRSAVIKQMIGFWGKGRDTRLPFLAFLTFLLKMLSVVYLLSYNVSVMDNGEVDAAFLFPPEGMCLLSVLKRDGTLHVSVRKNISKLCLKSVWTACHTLWDFIFLRNLTLFGSS